MSEEQVATKYRIDVEADDLLHEYGLDIEESDDEV